MKNLITIVFSLMVLQGCQHKDPVTKFRESVQIKKTFYFEPSTLRMINLKQNPDFNEAVKNVEEGRFFMVERNAHTDSAVYRLKEDVATAGFDELMTLRNRNTDIVIYALDKEKPVILGIALTDTVYNIVEVRGMINLAKIPGILNQVNNDEFLNVMSLTNSPKRNPHGEPDTTDQKPQ